jgi:hypothetical protein
MLSQRKKTERRRRELQERLRELSFTPLMRGSIVERVRRCGSPNCACATDPAARHRGKYLSVHLDGRTQVVHVRPVDEEQIQRRIDAYDELWEVINELTACELDDLRRRARERQRGRRRRRK